MISIVPISFLLSCYLTESLSMPCGSPLEIARHRGPLRRIRRRRPLVKGGDEYPAREVESREMFDASLFCYFLLNITATN